MLEHRMELFACRASKNFAAKVIDEMNGFLKDEKVHLGSSEVTMFSDGEFQPAYTESVRGATVFIIQSTFPPTDNLMELLLSIDAAKRASADKVIAVMPYFGWARQDRKDRPRVAIGAKLVANMLRAAGADRVMTCDLHADQIQGFFDIPVDHIYASKVFIPFIKSQNIENLAIAAPDMGGAKRALAYAKHLECPVIICHKSRERANVVGSITAIGDVEGKNVIIVDDDIDIFDDRQVEWAVATRMQGDRILRIPGAAGSSLDPSSHGKTTWQVGFDATIPVGADLSLYKKATLE